jgi:hypothetical protein
MQSTSYPDGAWKYSIEPRGIEPVSMQSAVEDVRGSYKLAIDRRIAEQSLQLGHAVPVDGGAVSRDRSVLAYLFGGGAR